MRSPRLALWLALTLLAIGTGPAQAQFAPAQSAPAMPWEQWFAALNAGDVPSIIALMRTEIDEGACWCRAAPAAAPAWT